MARPNIYKTTWQSLFNYLCGNIVRIEVGSAFSIGELFNDEYFKSNRLIYSPEVLL
jgi:hypothetical protein